jgi:hypothetical protein
VLQPEGDIRPADQGCLIAIWLGEDCEVWGKRWGCCLIHQPGRPGTIGHVV